MQEQSHKAYQPTSWNYHINPYVWAIWLLTTCSWSLWSASEGTRWSSWGSGRHWRWIKWQHTSFKLVTNLFRHHCPITASIIYMYIWSHLHNHHSVNKGSVLPKSSHSPWFLDVQEDCWSHKLIEGVHDSLRNNVLCSARGLLMASSYGIHCTGHHSKANSLWVSWKFVFYGKETSSNFLAIFIGELDQAAR